MNSSLRTWLKGRSLLSFFVMSFVWAWACWSLIGIINPGLLASPLILVGAWAPTLSAVLLTGMIGRKTGVRDFLKLGLLWRVGIRWYITAIFGIPLIGVAAIGLSVSMGGSFPQITLPAGMPANRLYVFLPIIYLSNIFIGGPIAEEFGWRGFALPRLQTRMGALRAGLVIGVIWAVWHLPFTFFPEGASVVGGIPFYLYLPLLTAWSVLFAWIFNNTNGSVLMMILFHASMNTTLGSLGL